MFNKEGPFQNIICINTVTGAILLRGSVSVLSIKGGHKPTRSIKHKQLCVYIFLKGTLKIREDKTSYGLG